MIADIQGVPLSALFTPTTRDPLKAQDAQKISTLAGKVLALVIGQIKQGSLACFDAHAQDFGCERYAFSVCKIVTGRSIREECQAIEGQEDKSPEKILVSKDLAFLLQCFLLRQVRETVQKKGSDLEEFVCKPTKITALVKGISVSLCKRIVYLFQTRVSRESTQRVRDEAGVLATLGPKEKVRIVEVLSPPILEVVDQFDGIVTRCFSDSYYSLKTVIVMLREMRVPVLVKRMVKLGERASGTLFLSQGSDRPFLPVDKKALPSNSPLVVIEGDYKPGLNSEDVRGKMAIYGLENVIRATGAQYSKGVVKEDKEVLDAIGQKDLLECDQEKEPFFKLDHVFCSSLAEEDEQGDIL